MAQPLLSRLKQSGATIDVLAPEWVAPVLHRMPEVDEVIAAPFRHGALQLGERWRLGRSARAPRLRGGVRAAEQLEVGAGSVFRPHSQTHRLRGRAARGLLNRVFPNSNLRCRALRAPRERAGQRAEAAAADRLEEEIRETCRRFGIGGQYTVLCPGAEYGPAKRWPYFRSSPQGSARKPWCSAPEGRTSRAGIPGRTSSGRPARRSDPAHRRRSAVVSNDSGLMHVAAARAAAGRALRLLQPRTYPARLAGGARAVAQAGMQPLLRTRMPARPFSLYEGDHRRAGLAAMDRA